MSAEQTSFAMNSTAPIGDGLVIAIESSTRVASIAVSFRGRTLESQLASERAHASDMLPSIDRALRELGATPKDIRAIVVGTGPGSYTGLRVGIATALGIARASGASILAVPSGETLAFGMLEPGAEALMLLDARSNELYFAHYRRTQDEVEVVVAPRVVVAADVPALVGSDSSALALPIFGDATVAEAAHLDDATRARLVADATPRAAALLALGIARLERGLRHRLEEVEPLYLRPFVATERKR